MLAAATAALGRFPSGGALAITGHTDDVDSEAHNQQLSERRAQAVGDRLAQLADLSGWQVSLAGKGESEPRVANDSDEKRAVNMPPRWQRYWGIGATNACSLSLLNGATRYLPMQRVGGSGVVWPMTNRSVFPVRGRTPLSSCPSCGPIPVRTR
ncbi:OmpA family protein [Actinomyces gaoshouyii]|uniref:OmpA family protein n=1 Tax=Actinomyces gaoshouyii TaxID=1960083 RepID=UPI0027E54563|nr:OmpA family protein [Actinomyces gaoshouyii]